MSTFGAFCYGSSDESLWWLSSDAGFPMFVTILGKVALLEHD